MILPLQISFRNMKPSEAVETRVRKEVAKLETFCPRIMHCRVVIELPHQHRQKGDLYHVRIDLTVPGGEIVVKHEPSLAATLRRVDVEKRSKSAEAHVAHKDIYVVIRDAFKEARRQLQDYTRRASPKAKRHETMPAGRVIKLVPDEGYGFLEATDGHQVYFHRNSVLNRAFNRLKLGSQVAFVEELGEKGAQASTVKPLRTNHATVVNA